MAHFMCERETQSYGYPPGIVYATIDEDDAPIHRQEGINRCFRSQTVFRCNLDAEIEIHYRFDVDGDTVTSISVTELICLSPNVGI